MSSAAGNLNMNLKLKVAFKTRSFLNNYNKRQRQFKYNLWIFSSADLVLLPLSENVQGALSPQTKCSE